MKKYTKKNRHQIISVNEQDSLNVAKSQLIKSIQSETSTTLGKTPSMTDSLENFNKVRQDNDAFFESSRLFQETGDVFYLSTCLHIISLGIDVDRNQFLALIGEYPNLILRDYCRAVYYTIRKDWPEAFLLFRQVYLECSNKNSQIPPQVLPLCIIDISSTEGGASGQDCEDS